MKEIIGFLIFCGFMQLIAGASSKDTNFIRRLELTPLSKYPQRYITKKWPTYSYKPSSRPRPSYTIPVPMDDSYKPTPVKKPARPNKKKPNYSYQHISRPTDYNYPRPEKPIFSVHPNLPNKPENIPYQQTSPSEYRPQHPFDYPNRPNESGDSYNLSYQIYNKPKPKPNNKPQHTKPIERPQNLNVYPSRPNKPDDLNPSYQLYIKPKPKPSAYPKPLTYPKPIHTISHPHTSNDLDNEDSPSYQEVKPSSIYQVYPSRPGSSGASSDHSPASAAPYPIQFLQEPSNTYEEEYPSQFYETHHEVPAHAANLGQFLQNDNNWRQDEDPYFDRIVVNPYEQIYTGQRPNGNDELFDDPEVFEELNEAIFEKEPLQERSIRRKSNDVYQKTYSHLQGLVPYKTWEYNPAAHNLQKIWKSKFYHPYNWWSHKKPQHIYYLQNKLRKPFVSHSSPYGYTNPDALYPWGHLPLLSARPASVHRIPNIFMDREEADPSMEDYSDEVFANYLKRPTEQIDGFFGRSEVPQRIPLNFKKKYYNNRGI